jgi:hypothetical protein
MPAALAEKERGVVRNWAGDEVGETRVRVELERA